MLHRNNLEKKIIQKGIKVDRDSEEVIFHINAVYQRYGGKRFLWWHGTLQEAVKKKLKK